MFPTKALAQDQRAALQRMLDAAFPTEPPPVDVYDGDTPQEARAAIRSRARLLVTNPDMLHQSMLPVHGQFQRFLANLRYVVVDEGHMYKGAFGCHVSAVLRRLRRICAREFAREPVFAVTSATSSQPEQHVCALLGVQAVHVVSDDGSPHGPRLFALWNPPLTVGKAGGAPLPAGAAKPPPRPGFLSHTESRVRSLELRRAKQEAARQAQRARNAARTGAVSLRRGPTRRVDVCCTPVLLPTQHPYCVRARSRRSSSCAAQRLPEVSVHILRRLLCAVSLCLPRAIPALGR